MVYKNLQIKNIVFIFALLLVLTYINKNASGGGSWPASQEKTHIQ
jgi:hypothetical protein